MCVIPQVEAFANFTFGKNEDRKRKLVYVGVDDYEVKVRSFFTMLLFFSTLLKKGLFGMRNNFDALTAYRRGLEAGLLCHS
jgi:hypothetical protein